ncbi:MAG: hypothetical protein JSS68_04545 [Actinobacteria bacterium]|nr:hypothetical protein [Actinomycetota bacterium]
MSVVAVIVIVLVVVLLPAILFVARRRAAARAADRPSTVDYEDQPVRSHAEASRRAPHRGHH